MINIIKSLRNQPMARPLIVKENKRNKPLDVGGFSITVLASATMKYSIYQDLRARARDLTFTHGMNHFLLLMVSCIVV